MSQGAFADRCTALAHELADASGKIALSHFRANVTVDTKSDATPVTIAALPRRRPECWVPCDSWLVAMIIFPHLAFKPKSCRASCRTAALAPSAKRCTRGPSSWG